MGRQRAVTLLCRPGEPAPGYRQALPRPPKLRVFSRSDGSRPTRGFVQPGSGSSRDMLVSPLVGCQKVANRRNYGQGYAPHIQAVASSYTPVHLTLASQQHPARRLCWVHAYRSRARPWAAGVGLEEVLHCAGLAGAEAQLRNDRQRPFVVNEEEVATVTKRFAVARRRLILRPACELVGSHFAV